MAKKRKKSDSSVDYYEEDDEVLVEEDEEFDEEEFDEEDEETSVPKAPKGNTILTLLLCLLNVIAACAFSYLLILDYQVRYNWSKAVFLHDLKLQGMPLKEED